MAIATVVVVDDEPNLLTLVCEVLEDADYQAIPCSHGRRALSCIQDTHPDLVVLDVQMPDVDGITIFRRMRLDPRCEDIPVIFLTANAHRVVQQVPNFREHRAALLSKPFDINAFLGLVDDTLAA